VRRRTGREHREVAHEVLPRREPVGVGGVAPAPMEAAGDGWHRDVIYRVAADGASARRGCATIRGMLERAHRSGVTDADVARPLPGDDLVAGARMIVDRATVLPAGPEAAWPWLAQLGKGRAGWYAPRAVEQFEVVTVEPPRALVYRTLRRWPHERPWPPLGTPVPDFAVVASWALVLDPAGPGRSRLHVRLRAQRGTWSARTEPLLWIGGWFDYLTIAAMFAGLREHLPYAAAASSAVAGSASASARLALALRGTSSAISAPAASTAAAIGSAAVIPSVNVCGSP
jgi:hypothetical protein